MIHALIILSDDKLISGSCDSTVRIWDLNQSWKNVSSIILRGHTSNVHALAKFADGRFASGSVDQTIRIWEDIDGLWTCMAILMGHTHEICSLAMLSNGQLASGAFDEKILCWDVGCTKNIASTHEVAQTVDHQVATGITNPSAFYQNCSEKNGENTQHDDQENKCAVS